MQATAKIEHSDLLRLDDRTLNVERRLLVEVIKTRWAKTEYWVNNYQDIFSGPIMEIELDSFKHLQIKQFFKKLRLELLADIERLEAIIEEQERRKIP